MEVEFNQILLDNYQPSDEVKSVVRKTTVILIAGISGVGKDAIKRGLLETNRFYHLVSYTTRKPRINNGELEQDGREYHFIDQAQATKMLKNKAFIEAKLVHGNLYGTGINELRRAINNHQIPTTDIDIYGIAEYYKINNQIKPIFVLPSSCQSWLKRFEQRYNSESEFKISWQKRKQTSIQELEYVLNEVNYYNFVINDNLALATKQVKSFFLENIPLPDQNACRIVAQAILDQLKIS